MIGTCFELFDLEEEDINYSLREYLSEVISQNLYNTLDKEGNVTGYKNVIDKEYAIFFQRLLTKPMPPKPKWEGHPTHGGFESIEQLVSSQRWKDYEKAKLVWILGGGFNSSNIPSFDKWFQQADFPDIKINK